MPKSINTNNINTMTMNNNNKKIYWVSRHLPLASQLKELKRLFGENTEVIVDPRPFSSASEIAQRYRQSGCNDILVVAPLSVIQKLVEEGLHPLWSEMAVVSKEEAEVEVNGRHYRFVRFRRVKGITIEFEDLDGEKI